MTAIPGGMAVCKECYEYRTKHETGVCYTCRKDFTPKTFLDHFAVENPIPFPLPVTTKLPCEGKWKQFDMPTPNQETRDICHACPAYGWCLDWGIENDEYGVRGGLSRAERRQVKAGAPGLARGHYTLVA